MLLIEQWPFINALGVNIMCPFAVEFRRGVKEEDVASVSGVALD